MAIDLQWKTGSPSNIGLHFVAVKLGVAAGTFDFLTWSGESWEGLEHGAVIAFASLQDLKNALDIKWPEESELNYQSRKLPQNDSDLWKEE